MHDFDSWAGDKWRPMRTVRRFGGSLGAFVGFSSSASSWPASVVSGSSARHMRGACARVLRRRFATLVLPAHGVSLARFMPATALGAAVQLRPRQDPCPRRLPGRDHQLRALRRGHQEVRQLQVLLRRCRSAAVSGAFVLAMDAVLAALVFSARSVAQALRPCDSPQRFGAASSPLRVPCRIVFLDALLGGGAARCLISRRQLLSVGVVAEFGLVSDLVSVPWCPQICRCVF